MMLGGFVVRQLRAAPARAVVLGVGLLVAAVAFSTLASESRSSTVAVRGTLNSNFRPAYDILVRPAGTRTALERKRRLVDDNFLSNLYGGISMAQWHTILHLPGVSVAAPVENVGYVLQGVSVKANLAKVVGTGSQQLFRVAPSFVVHGNLASFPLANTYFYYTTDKWVNSDQSLDGGKGAASLVVPGHSHPLPACLYYVHGQPPALGTELGPFATTPLEGMVCAGPHQDVHGARYILDRPGHYGVTLYFEFPALVAAIDPVQEAKLVHLPRAMVSGTYLKEGEGISAPVASHHGTQFHLKIRNLPLLASSRSFVDEALRVKVKRLSLGAGAANLPETLASAHAGSYLDGLSGPVVMTKTFDTASLYKASIAGFTNGNTRGLGRYFTTGGVRYRVLGPKTLRPIRVSNPASVWAPTSGHAGFIGAMGPPGGNAPQYRRLYPFDPTRVVIPNAKGPGATYQTPEAVLQGTFDPAKLPAFAPLSKVPMQTFYPPTVTGATPASRAVLGDKPLGPTTNIGGYLGQPPLFLTTMKAAQIFFRSKIYTGANGDKRKAPVAAIEVKVARLNGANTASIAQVKKVATEIYRATHLQVDITAGSSPTPVTIHLPGDRFGQPALVVQQGWVKKGVATVILGALGAKDLALFVLVALVAALFVANASFASVRQRRREIATLSTIGWKRRQIFAAVLGEVAIIGLCAGVAGAAISSAIVAALAVHFPVLRVVAVIPAAVVVAVLAGGVPAWRAARLSPLAGLAPPVSTRVARRRVKTVVRLGLLNLARLPGRTVLGVVGLIVGVGTLAFLLGIQTAFSGAVAGDVLGNAINVQVRSADYVAVALVIALGAGSVADVLVMNLRERVGELAALRATGWADSALREVVVTEGLAIGLVGSALGAAGGLGAVLLFGAPIASVYAGTLGALGAGIAVCMCALLPALSLLTRRLPALSLAGE
ncbi:MAG: FtsX-like permease family protein [Acidimicrobiales bacterium]